MAPRLRVAALVLLVGSGLAVLAAPGAPAQPTPERRTGIGSNLSTSGWTAEPVVPRAAPPPAPAPIPAPAAPAAAADVGGERDLATSVWRYVTANRDPRTGLINGVDGYGRATVWDIASGLAALLCARQLALIGRDEFDRLADQLLATLVALPLYADELPNREYAVAGPQLVDLHGRISSRGSGWSALDVGRLLVWLRILAAWYPERASQASAVVRRWRFARLARGGELNGLLDDGGDGGLRQEGRFGYEQYAAAAFRLWDVAVPRAFDLADVRRVELLGLAVPYDTRNLAFLTSEPFILARLEIGAVEPTFDDAVGVVYAVQRARAEASGRPTAMSEDAIDQPPWFVYDNIYFEGRAWACVDHGGRPAPTRSSLSSKAALGWWAIYPDPYTTALRDLVASRLRGPRGVLGGLYDADDRPNRSLNINTNAVVLESLLYRQRGGRPFLADAPPHVPRP